MDSLDFSKVYTTILYSKAILGISGFVLFFILSFVTLYWIRLSYTKQYSQAQLPVVITKNRYAYGVITLASTLIGIIGSFVVEGIGWEEDLKLFHHTYVCVIN